MAHFGLEAGVIRAVHERGDGEILRVGGERAVKVEPVCVHPRSKFEPVRIHEWDDPNCRFVDEVGGPAVGTVVVEQMIDEVEAHLGADRLVAVHG